MAEGSGAAVVEAATAAVHDGWTLAGEGASEAVASIKAEESAAKGASEGEDVSKAASELGKRGGKAAAEARAKAAKDAPEPAKEPKAEPKAPEPADADDETDEAPDDKRSRARQRVEEATRKAAEARRERDAAARERDEARAELDRERRARQAPQPAPEPRRQAEPEQDGPPEPKAEDFEDFNQYQQALIDHRVERKLQAVQKETEDRQRAEKRAENVVSKVRSFQSKIQEAGGADFLAEISEEVQALRPTIALQPGERPTGGNFLADALLHQAEHAPALMRHLSDNPREFQRIAELGSPYQIALEVGRLTGLFEARGGATAGSPPPSGSPASKPVSKAPPPVRPVTGAPSTAAGDYFREGEDFDSWNRRQRVAGR